MRLASNGIKTAAWYGTDASRIVYPHVSSCVTVTCLTRGRLAGLHLAMFLRQEETDEDLHTFATVAKGATSMYLIGMLGGWMDGNARNRTGLHYQSTGKGTLIERLRDILEYDGIVHVCNTSGLSGEIEIVASLSQGGVSFTWSDECGEDPALAKPLTQFQAVAGTVIFQQPAPMRGASGCFNPCVIV